MMMSFLFVGLGGALGAMARYGISLGVPKFDPTSGWPLATLTANLLGSLIIGLSVAMLFTPGKLGEGARLFLVIGVLGGFTTFSSFSLELVQLVQAGRVGPATIYWIASSVIVPLACLGGWLLGRQFT